MIVLPVASRSSAESLPSSGSIVKEESSEPVTYTLPDKKGRSRFTRWLDYIFFSYYRKTFTVVFASNFIAFIALVVRNEGWPLAPEVGTAASANLMVALLFRQENFVNLVYEIAVACPHSAPLWLRRRLAKVFHYGGAHSGAGVAAVVWYIMYTVITTRDYILRPVNAGLANLITSYVVLAMFCFILAGAHPTFRRKYHDHFEAMHRYSGWVALMTFWTHTVFAGEQYRKLDENPKSLGMYLITSPNFWTFLISTSCSIISWSRLRHHDVYPERLSDHAIRLHFKYREMPPFYGLKVSTRPLLEWHAFATIPNDDNGGSGRRGFSVVVSNAGDWTKESIQNPPKKLWIRGYPLHGLLYTSKLFKRIVVVATGSGIGPCLSLLWADVTPRRVLWSTPNPESTFGDKIVGAVKKADPKAVIWNTRTQGRPDMIMLTYQLVREFDAEAVFIISNPKITRKVVYGMESRGVAAYGAIFDS
ncbi:hypothetical protein K435DRAFT_755019 [Dendrothele bispora CBS 962.96]|uniref:Nonribosomal peptide synthetase 12 n=1 Tax=Dendrothele bispora (strain CBS 962.96) TaxID=1314807 RepID=A0A4S8M3G1_DENBC|nr:hypothetical protein K435DRAFT_755019 [Dendrothele bispora CBS 962.96]